MSVCRLFVLLQGQSEQIYISMQLIYVAVVVLFSEHFLRRERLDFTCVYVTSVGNEGIVLL